MIRRIALTLALLAPGLAPFLAVAQPSYKPPPTPTRDVDVMYEIPTREGPAPQRLRFSLMRQAFRIDPPGRGLYVIVDQARGRMYTVRDDDRSVIDMAAPTAWMPGIHGGNFRRRGDDVIAGQPCTDWETNDSERRTVLVCMTLDGVMLRARTAQGATLITAKTVKYAPVDEQIFLVPGNYRRLAPPPIPNAR